MQKRSDSPKREEQEPETDKKTQHDSSKQNSENTDQGLKSHTKHKPLTGELTPFFFFLITQLLRFVQFL